MSDHLTPLDVCVRLIGPQPLIEKITGRRPKGSYAWKRPARSRNPGDIPDDAKRDLLKHARRNNIPLTAGHLIWGASRAEIEALLEQVAREKVAAE